MVRIRLDMSDVSDADESDEQMYRGGGSHSRNGTRPQYAYAPSCSAPVIQWPSPPPDGGCAMRHHRPMFCSSQSPASPDSCRGPALWPHKRRRAFSRCRHTCSGDRRGLTKRWMDRRIGGRAKEEQRVCSQHAHNVRGRPMFSNRENHTLCLSAHAWYQACMGSTKHA